MLCVCAVNGQFQCLVQMRDFYIRIGNTGNFISCYLFILDIYLFQPVVWNQSSLDFDILTITMQQILAIKRTKTASFIILFGGSALEITLVGLFHPLSIHNMYTLYDKV